MSPDIEPLQDEQQIRKTYNRARWSIFISSTVGYGLYYVCRLSLNVVKKPIVNEGVLTESQLGMIGSALFITYALGKLANGFLADRSNIRRFLSIGLLLSAVINLLLGLTNTFVVFLVLWALNGWVQSIGAAPCVVGLSRWFSNKERGTFYGLWSSSHNIGEALTFIVTAMVVASWGWQWGFHVAGLIGIAGVVMTMLMMRDTPGSMGLPPINEYKGDDTVEKAKDDDTHPISYYQKQLLRNPAIWLLALSSAFMYISRYAVNSWGIFYLEAEKGYSIIEASSIISISSVCGIVGTALCGWFSDKFFAGKRNMPAFIFGVMNVAALALFLFGPRDAYWVDVTSMVLFGLAIGTLICYLGGLMAVDIASKKASGAALGIIGIASYLGAAIQDMVSGFTIESNKTMVDGVAHYDFSTVSWFWLIAAILSVILALGVWVLSKRKEAALVE
ncbi:MAG: MFS transporter [Rikenellaceae bacterium]